MQETAEDAARRDAAAAVAPIPELLQSDAHNLINAILARTRALRQASLAARAMTSRAPKVIRFHYMALTHWRCKHVVLGLSCIQAGMLICALAMMNVPKQTETMICAKTPLTAQLLGRCCSDDSPFSICLGSVNYAGDILTLSQGPMSV